MSHELEQDFDSLVKQVIMGAEIVTGLDWIITSGRRTAEEQQRLYDQGRKTPGQIVTKAAPGYSAHNYGLAADLAPIKEGKIWWNAPDEIWQAMADTAVKAGLSAGYYFTSFKDMPHIEHPRWKVQQAKWKAGEIQLA